MSNNVIDIIENKNKTTGDDLSIIPQYTLSTMLDWQAKNDLALQGTLTWYVRPKPQQYTSQGKATAGIDTLFDKRHFREGNALISGANGTDACGGGARTANEPGRTDSMQLRLHV